MIDTGNLPHGLAPLDLSRFGDALKWPGGYAEILMIGLCIGLAYAIDRRFERFESRRDPGERRGDIVRVAFPLLALLFLFIAAWTYRRFFGAPILLPIAIPLIAALAVIRALVYGLRRLFPKQSWLPGWERGIGATVWVMLLLYYLGVLPEIVSALDDIEVPLGAVHPTLLSILTGAAVVLGSLILTLWISGMIEGRINRATSLDTNLRAVVSRVVRALLLVAGALITLQAVGFDLTLLTVFGGAIGVGIGLGLQKLASNYIAGFTILLDQSIRLGDTITVEGKWTGRVTSVTARYVLVRRLDGVEVIVPNETLITTTVLNHSHAAPQIRVATQVAVTPDADVEKALGLLCQAARADPRVLREPPFLPAAVIQSFGERGITLELGVFVNDPLVDQLALRGVIQREILRLFNENGIPIAYPWAAMTPPASQPT
jgi:small-conductance mechanosensitive channel